MKCFAAIDLKSFYASVECVERGFDPLNVNLVVADESRTEKTICLAVSPSLKAHGISGRARLFEVIQQVKQINRDRAKRAPFHRFSGDSIYDDDLKKDPSLALNYYIAPPRMAKYMEYSDGIYDIYRKYISEEDIHVYSIDEVFIELTAYLDFYQMSAEEIVGMMIRDVYQSYGITATAGIGTNLYLAKIAMDIVAKRSQPDENGVRMAFLDEISFRELLWDHKPLTDFWRIGPGIARKMQEYGMETIGDLAEKSLKDQALLYKLFGVNAELLIDHAWGREPCKMEDIRTYLPENNSLGIGQVLKEPYSQEDIKIVLDEMAESLALDLVRKRLVCNQIVVNIGFDISSVSGYQGEIKADFYGRMVPKGFHGSFNFDRFTSSGEQIRKAADSLLDSIENKELLTRRLNITAVHVLPESRAPQRSDRQLDLFFDHSDLLEKETKQLKREKEEKKMQQAMIQIKDRYGKNAVLKGTSYLKKATARERNSQIGGHKAE